MPFQNVVNLTRHPEQVIVRSMRGKTYTAILDKDVEIPEPIKTGNANYVRAMVEFDQGTPVIKSFDYEEKATPEEIQRQQQEYLELGGDY